MGICQDHIGSWILQWTFSGIPGMMIDAGRQKHWALQPVEPAENDVLRSSRHGYPHQTVRHCWTLAQHAMNGEWVQFKHIQTRESVEVETGCTLYVTLAISWKQLRWSGRNSKIMRWCHGFLHIAQLDTPCQRLDRRWENIFPQILQ